MYNIVLFILLGAIINASTNASTNTSNNMCKINKHKYLCGNNLNYNRNIMPQYNSTHHYYNSDIYTIHSSKLIPSQNEINLDKVMYLYHNYNKSLDIPIIITKNLYIIDGHHRYAYHRLKNDYVNVIILKNL